MPEHSKLEQLAQLSVARGSGFVALAITTVMVGLSGHMPTAFKAGGVLALLTCMILLLKAAYAFRRRYRDTELWIMLDPDDRPAKATAQRVVGATLRHMYLTFARHFALGSTALLAGSLVLGLLGTPAESQTRRPLSMETLSTARYPGLAPHETSAFRRMP